MAISGSIPQPRTPALSTAGCFLPDQPLLYTLLGLNVPCDSLHGVNLANAGVVEGEADGGPLAGRPAKRPSLLGGYRKSERGGEERTTADHGAVFIAALLCLDTAFWADFPSLSLPRQ